MNVGNTVFSQLMSLIPDYELRKCIDRYRGDFHARRFTCRDQFLIMSYAQFTSSASCIMSNKIFTNSLMSSVRYCLKGLR